MQDLRHLETRQNLGRSWYDYSWDWVLASLFALVLLTGIAFLAGIALWTSQPQTAAILDDATTGQSTRPSVPNLPD
jgi:hypothetical protein